MPSSTAEHNLDWQEWKDGVWLPAYNDRLLCSSRDPLTEASKWCDRYAQSLDAVSTLVVIGLGAAFHIKELCLREPSKKLLVIEKEAELREAFERQAFDEVQLFASDAIEELLEQVKPTDFAVLSFLPALSHWQKEASQVSHQLLGRDGNALGRLLQASGLSATLPEKLSVSVPSRELFNHLCHTANNEEEKVIWGALGELIK